MTTDPVVENNKTLLLSLQDMMRAYYDGDIGKSLDYLAMARNRLDALSYHIFKTTHWSGEVK